MPRIVLAGVGERMTAVAGAVADGFFCHPLTTERYLREVTVPALRARPAPTWTASRSSASSSSSPARRTRPSSRQPPGTRRQIAFYASTPAYRPVLERHGWGELQTDLNRLSKNGEWRAMGELVDDEMLATFAVVGAARRRSPPS